MRQLLYSLIVLLFLCSPSVALEKLTHESINSAIAPAIDQYLSSIGFTGGTSAIVNGKKVIQWIEQGGIEEDEPMYTRSRNHFHNPLLTWDQAGLSGVPPLTGISSALWIKDQTNRRVTDLGGDWSWMKARQFYYAALTGDCTALDGVAVDDGTGPMIILGTTNMTETWRKRFFAWTFRAVGQTIHLVQDASVPSHTRNDAHAFRDYEGYVLESRGTTSFQNWISNPQSFAGTITSIASFIDTGQYRAGNNPDATVALTYGLAEYSNANFFSEDTINLPGYTMNTEFPYPNKDNTDFELYRSQGKLPEIVTAEDGKQDRTIYISKTGPDGAEIVHFAKSGYLADEGNASDYHLYFQLDDKCYDDYAEKLIPRAVGYSAGLLNYFFRGTLDIAWPNEGVYAISDGSKTEYTDIKGNRHQQFKHVKAKIMNTTPNESIGEGNLTAVARYKIIPNYAPDLSNYPPDDMTMKAVTEYSYSYSVSKSVRVNAVPTFYIELPFDFSESPIPAGITDLTLQVVFKGTIGNETGNAIAVGMRDISEPTHITFWNLTDRFSVPYPGEDYQLYTSGQLESLAKPGTTLLSWLDKTGDNSLADEFFLKDTTSTYTISFSDGEYWSPVTSVRMSPGEYIRMIVLVDPNEYVYKAAELKWDNSNNPIKNPDSFRYPFPGVVNQADNAGKYINPTDSRDFRKVYGSDGQTIVPSKQHWFMGHGSCVVGASKEVSSALCPPAPYLNLDLVSPAPLPLN